VKAQPEGFSPYQKAVRYGLNISVEVAKEEVRFRVKPSSFSSFMWTIQS